MDKNALTSHTPEPWSSKGGTVYQGRHGGFDLRYGPNPEADCRRIVACVNACYGISNEMLADDCFGKMMRDRDSLLTECDELLAVLESLVDWSEDAIVCMQETAGSEKTLKQMEDCGLIPSQIVLARAAIAKAKGVADE